MNASVIRFQGRLQCRREEAGPLGLTLSGRTAERPDEAVHLAFAARAPDGMPEELNDAIVEPLGDRLYRISAGGRHWDIHGSAHLHRDVSEAFYKAIPPQPVPWTKRLFWRTLLALAANPLGRRILKLLR